MTNGCRSGGASVNINIHSSQLQLIPPLNEIIMIFYQAASEFVDGILAKRISHERGFIEMEFFLQ